MMSKDTLLARCNVQLVFSSLHTYALTLEWRDAMATSTLKPSLASTLLALSESAPTAAWGSLSTACSSVDDVLLGGLPYGSITSISGSHPASRTLVRSWIGSFYRHYYR